VVIVCTIRGDDDDEKIGDELAVRGMKCKSMSRSQVQGRRSLNPGDPGMRKRKALAKRSRLRLFATQQRAIDRCGVECIGAAKGHCGDLQCLITVPHVDIEQDVLWLQPSCDARDVIRHEFLPNQIALDASCPRLLLQTQPMRVRIKMVQRMDPRRPGPERSQIAFGLPCFPTNARRSCGRLPGAC
jgi:hypothetical protein